ncbi:MAG: NAD(P)/FAD-dependent oxidoreductase [Rhodospirillaceae bacterium]|jgi:cation diffusion facilitator CzcD-associated flavoprotein CzcO|nr:NAD(P)/FAD-dependent oxidoreductase [Rhodospirillaceae bacterium]MBT5239364.1 NAD(P)/FAD-dependent oxidoreductase [Rhodospirillaceae bacterium]MBT5566382.1 NAD(P)/FAD-dependent oxidoreductase [Rhodospirillaceae bacterium]MBT6088475.1 NAD(P)/FAD-dependent oxidoreductase [Rhodospirillaceae bacterium]MBT6962083.1 NAD(P)/FAD-dependent oxidoreductase [Rhodospirillaceae bacterium]
MTQTDIDVLIVGAGFGGLYALHKMRECGFTAQVFEAGDDVGGTWYWNRYPGCRCDVESIHYSYQFDNDLQQEWVWTERYATQPEILSYIQHVAERFDLRKDITFNARVTAATWQEDDACWLVETETGEPVRAKYCIMATGPLSVPNMPDFPGLESYTGDTYHTGLWPHEGVDFTGKRVAIIGTGSSAIQSIPLIAEQADHLTVFQRTANYAVPAANRPMKPGELEAVKAEYQELRTRGKNFPTAIPVTPSGPSALAVSEEERKRTFEEWWQDKGLMFQAAFADLMFNDDANDTVSDFVRGKIHSIVEDPATAAILAPKNPFGCKRMCVDTDYYKTFNRDNVSLVDVKDTPIDRIVANGVLVGDTTYEADAVIFATGYDAMTGALSKMHVCGRNGLVLTDKWNEGPSSYLGLAVQGFPNLFTINGPGSPSALVNMVTGCEHHVEWIADCLTHLRETGSRAIEAEKPAEDVWVEHSREVGEASLRSACDSWYLGANIPGKPRVFMPYLGGFPAYAEKCETVARNGYDGFSIF